MNISRTLCIVLLVMVKFSGFVYNLSSVELFKDPKTACLANIINGEAIDLPNFPINPNKANTQIPQVSSKPEKPSHGKNESNNRILTLTSQNYYCFDFLSRIDTQGKVPRYLIGHISNFLQLI